MSHWNKRILKIMGFHHTSLLNFKTKVLSWVWICLTQRHTQVLTKPFGQKMSKHAWLSYALTVTKSLLPRALHTELCLQHQKELPLLSVSKSYTDQCEGTMRGRIQHSSWMTLPARKVINRRVCSTLIWLYFSQDFKEKALLNTSRSQKSIAKSSKNATVIVSEGSPGNKGCNSILKPHTPVCQINLNDIFAQAFLDFAAQHKHLSCGQQLSCQHSFSDTSIKENGNESLECWCLKEILTFQVLILFTKII